MQILSNQEIGANCVAVVARAEAYQPLQWIAFQVMMGTGCREGEAMDLTRWTLTPYGVYTLHPQKGNSIREIQAVSLPQAFRVWIADRPSGQSPTSLARLRSSFVQLNNYSDLRSGKKGISTHLFRYNYIRSLKAEGKTIREIKAIMGLSSSLVIQRYQDNDITAN